MARRKLTGMEEEGMDKQYKERLKMFEGKETTPAKKDKRIREKQEEVLPDWMPKLRKVDRREAVREASNRPSPSKRTFQEKLEMFGGERRGYRQRGPTRKTSSVVRRSVEEPSFVDEKAKGGELSGGRRLTSRQYSKTPGSRRRTVMSRIDSGLKPQVVSWAPVKERTRGRVARAPTPYPQFLREREDRKSMTTKDRTLSTFRGDGSPKVSPRMEVSGSLAREGTTPRGLSVRKSHVSPEYSKEPSRSARRSQVRESRTSAEYPEETSGSAQRSPVRESRTSAEYPEEPSRSARRSPVRESRTSAEYPEEPSRSARRSPVRESRTSAEYPEEPSRSARRSPVRESRTSAEYPEEPSRSARRSSFRESRTSPERPKEASRSAQRELLSSLERPRSSPRERSSTQRLPSMTQQTSQKSSSSRAPTSPRSVSRSPLVSPLDSLTDRSASIRSQPYDSISRDRRRSSAPVMLTSSEYIFHDIVRSGDVENAQDYHRSRQFDINARGHDGETALQIAVENQDETMTAFLVGQPNIETGDILLHAIQSGNLPIVKLLCERIGPPEEMMSFPSSFSFPPDMTPLQLAAIRNSYEIIDYLVNKRHHTLEDPHSPDCQCDECIEARKDLLAMTTRKLRQHKAVSTPAYYIHVTRDPIYHSFKLYEYLKKMGRFDIVLRPSYNEIADVVRQFPVDLLTQCRTSGEVRSVLSQAGGSSKFWGKLTKSEWPRLIMAMDYKQKEFSAHPNVQVMLENKWSGNFYAWRKASRLRKTLSPIVRIFVLPYIYLLLVLSPGSKQARHYALPVNKMISFLATYMVFLVSVFFQANETRKARRDRMYFFSEENTVYIFVFTYTISIARQIFVTHPKRFFSQGWNVYDVVMISLYWLTLAFWMSAFTHYLLLPNEHMKSLERKYWNAFDPMLVADGFFVVASIMAFLKLLFYFQLNFSVGPMQVALNVMIKDCVKYSLFITLIIFAFTSALGKFYAYYDGMKYVDPESGETIEQDSNSFVNLRSTFSCLFWGMFGMSDYAAADVVVENVQNANGTSYLVEHDFTEFIGYFAFGAYTILMTIVVINMLIATMSDTFAKVLGNLDTEWMVGRSEVYLYFFYQTVLPPPFNLLPHRYPPRKLRHTDDEEKQLIRGIEREEDYSEVVKKLVARYFARQGNS